LTNPTSPLVLLTNGTLVWDNVRTYHTYQYDEEIGQLTAVMQWDASGYHEYDPATPPPTTTGRSNSRFTSTVDPAGLALTTRYTYDSADDSYPRPNPAGGTSDTTPSTRVNVYYSAIDNAT